MFNIRCFGSAEKRAADAFCRRHCAEQVPKCRYTATIRRRMVDESGCQRTRLETRWGVGCGGTEALQNLFDSCSLILQNFFFLSAVDAARLLSCVYMAIVNLVGELGELLDVYTWSCRLCGLSSVCQRACTNDENDLCLILNCPGRAEMQAPGCEMVTPPRFRWPPE